MEENLIENVKLNNTVGTIKKEKNIFDYEQQLQCHICHELFLKAVTLSCSHSFCQYCINQWQRRRYNCPICRKRIHTQIPTLALDNLIAIMIEIGNEEVKTHRSALIAERAQVSALLSSKHRKRPKRMSSRLVQIKRAR